MFTRSIRAFVARDWHAARESKNAYWSERIKRLGSREGLRIAEELRRQAVLQDPGRPRPDDRQRDLLSHIRLAELLERVSPARRT